jgi:5-methylcytosine-specific restriction endonuclease McrA
METQNRYVRWARKRRDKLRQLLGGCCVQCGTTKKLEFDHINPATRTWDLRSVGYVRSMTLYWRDYDQGLLQLLCRKHNAMKSDSAPRPETCRPEIDEPF